MSKPLKAFRYSGAKDKVIPLLRELPTHKRLCELYLGSGQFLLQNNGNSLGIDINKNIISIWNFLKSTTPDRLVELEKIRYDAVNSHGQNKPDVRDLGLSEGEANYVRINCASVCVGQLSSWKLYPQHKLPIEQTIKLLPRIKEIDFVLGNAGSYQEQDGDIVFLDPPYQGTKGNYKENGKVGIEESYNPQQTIDLISRIQSPIILTYGTDAKITFPMYEWQELFTKKVPNLRKGGTIDRIEHVTYINW